LIKSVVIFVNYGPYHVARAAALRQNTALDPTFIELSSTQKHYPWSANKDAICDRLITLSARPYEECDRSDLRRKLIEKLDELKPDVVVIAGYSELPMRAAAKWARANGRQVVMMSDSTERDHQRHWWRERIKRSWIARNVDAGFVAGRAARAYLNQLGVSDVMIWQGYDVVDNNYFAEGAATVRKFAAAERAKAKLPERYFLYVGRLSPEKNLSVLLQSYKRYLESQRTPWGLVVVGDGPQRKELQGLAQGLSLNEVVWPGFKNIHELATYYGLADCLILPSTSEPWGLVVNEAMALGVPVLVSRACGCSLDLVRDGVNGYVFDPNDASRLVGLMTQMSDASCARLNEMGKASSKIIADFTPEIWARNLFQALTAVTGQAEVAEAELVASSAL
jgi:1,2-diacylglycerol 3-alpha-glucosyltransferase